MQSLFVKNGTETPGPVEAQVKGECCSVHVIFNHQIENSFIFKKYIRKKSKLLMTSDATNIKVKDAFFAINK